MPSLSTSLKSENTLNFLVLMFAILTLASNWFSPNVLKIFNVVISANNIIIYIALAVLCIISAFFSMKAASKAVFLGLLFSLFAFSYGQLTYYFPSPTYAEKTALLYNAYIKTQTHFILSFIISYVVSAFFCVIAIDKLNMLFLQRNAFYKVIIVYGLSAYAYKTIFNGISLLVGK